MPFSSTLVCFTAGISPYSPTKTQYIPELRQRTPLLFLSIFIINHTWKSSSPSVRNTPFPFHPLKIPLHPLFPPSCQNYSFRICHHTVLLPQNVQNEYSLLPVFHSSSACPHSGGGFQGNSQKPLQSYNRYIR